MNPADYTQLMEIVRQRDKLAKVRDALIEELGRTQVERDGLRTALAKIAARPCETPYLDKFPYTNPCSTCLAREALNPAKEVKPCHTTPDATTSASCMTGTATALHVQNVVSNAPANVPSEGGAIAPDAICGKCRCFPCECFPMTDSPLLVPSEGGATPELQSLKCTCVTGYLNDGHPMVYRDLRCPIHSSPPPKSPRERVEANRFTVKINCGEIACLTNPEGECVLADIALFLADELEQMEKRWKFQRDRNDENVAQWGKELGQALRERDEARAALSELKEFVRYITLQLQKHTSTTEAEKTADFQRAYRLYMKYDVEGIAARNQEPKP